MLTKNDLRNLRYLIHLKVRKAFSSIRFKFKQLRRKLKAGTLFAKPQPLTPQGMLCLPLIRNTFPTLMAGKIFSEFPIEVDKLGKKIITPFDEIVIDGGPSHDYVRGFIDRPWKLLHQTGEIESYENSHLSFKRINSSVVLDSLLPAWRVDLPSKVREKWEKRIQDYFNTEKGEINACLHEAMQTLQ